MAKKYIQARKTIETKTKGEFKYNKIHIFKLDNPLLIEQLESLSEKDEDDYECAYHNGFIFDMDGCLWSIDVDRLTTHLKQEIECEYTDDEDIEEYKVLIEAMQSEARHSSQA
jgi:hypothetical protein